MFQSKKVGLLAKIILLILLAYMIFTLVSVRQKIADANAAVETLTQQVSDQTQTNTELSNAIENRDDPSYVEDIAREKLGLVAPNDRVFNIADEGPRSLFAHCLSVITTRRILTIYGNQCRRNPGRNHQKHHQIRRVRLPAGRAVRFGPHL